MRQEQNRTNDFPELQIGYPERNDVTRPKDESEILREMERLHFDPERLELVRTTADGKVRENPEK